MSCIIEAHISLTTCTLWLIILPSGTSKLSHEDRQNTISFFFVIQVLPASLNDDDLFWRTYTLFNSKNVKIEKSRSVVSKTSMGCENSITKIFKGDSNLLLRRQSYNCQTLPLAIMTSWQPLSHLLT